MTLSSLQEALKTFDALINSVVLDIGDTEVSLIDTDSTKGSLGARIAIFFVKGRSEAGRGIGKEKTSPDSTCSHDQCDQPRKLKLCHNDPGCALISAV